MDGVVLVGDEEGESGMAGDVRAQVVVVGGGPVGLVVACELAGYGVRTVVVEERGGVSARPKATTLHARAVQCLVRRGYLAGLPGGRTASAPTRCGFHFAGIPGMDMCAPALEPPPVLKCEQERLERHFEARALAAGAVILRGLRVTGVRQGPEGVRVTAEGRHGPVTCTARYAVGADGARSVVREQAGFACRSYPATVSALAGDVRLEEPGALRPGWHRTERGWIVVKNIDEPADIDGTTGAGGVRLRTLNCTGAHRGRQLPPTLEELRREVAWITGREVAMGRARWLSRFSDFSRIARSYRAGRILLAGDAAHVHFPIGGQGLSAGVLDALGLGWKLALAVRGAAAPGLLDSYDQERRPAAQRVIDNTRAQLALMRPDAGLDPLRTLFGELLARGGEGEGGVLASMVSAQDTVLPARTADPSPWEGRFLPNTELATPQGRTDVIRLLAGGSPLLLLSGADGGRWEAQARPWAGLLRVVRVRAASPALPGGAVLVRPDGYVGWAAGAGPLAPALRTYFREDTGEGRDEGMGEGTGEGSGRGEGREREEPDTRATSTSTSTSTSTATGTGTVTDAGVDAGAGVVAGVGAGVGDAARGAVR
ncbi:FAD-dependent monooxygenase [Streptomyces sp. NBC_00989]|uniref:FAD-dependent monooxygenase n=1 Tax=Streptomyces sp. NBC_00989 TaxID=2903705 RepID=UPI00386FC387|nr:FAD-dependent monooxygenase [Streptomyces sp. NBC_00989]WSW98001.1 FAD-dependent monooxygenase [Streptomyces sp. NBC_00989]